jgi:hypothetical protein
MGDRKPMNSRLKKNLALTLVALSLPFAIETAEARRRVVVTAGPRHARVRVVVGRPRVVREVIVLEGRPAGRIDLDVDPADTKVYVDGSYRGIVDDFDGFPQKLVLHAGPHQIKLVTPEGVESAQVVVIRAGTEVSLDLELED